MVAVQERESAMQGRCRFCGGQGEGPAFSVWVRESFTNWDRLLPGEIVCAGCLPWFDQQSAELARLVGKDKPQRMQNYSHFVVGGQWIPVGKGDKALMRDILLRHPFPEMAVIADSGQKHIAFRAPRNPPGQSAGWAQFEEQRVWVESAALGALVDRIERLYVIFSKGEIESGDYSASRILAFGVPAWQELEQAIKGQRGSALFSLAIFLAQRKEDERGSDTPAGGGPSGADLEGDAGRLQEPLPPDDLAAVRRPGEVGGLHQQSGQAAQLALFEARGHHRDQRGGQRAGERHPGGRGRAGAAQGVAGGNDAHCAPGAGGQPGEAGGGSSAD